ncbi:response regulator [Thioalkalivibrio sp. HK1]|uniref:response regulator n=1 Tax=Thioalkalivibrio sp. HK1 TaxID=1469245 RepID=UPI0006858615|nr:response regulator [Thioalkalivibrio sp. HK1]
MTGQRKKSESLPLRVLVIDDHALFRGGLSELLARRGVDVCAAVGSGREGCRLAAEIDPDVVLLDLRMPDLDGLAALERLHEQGEDERPAVVVLTTSSDQGDLAAALRAGARGYLLKDMDPERLVQSLEAIFSGEMVVAPEMSGALAKIVRGDKDSGGDDRFSALTVREREILRHLAYGKSNKAIALDLGISDGTVKLHVRAILRKLEVRSRVEAAVLAVESRIFHA